MKKDKLVKVGRLAFREEGRMWNAYYALADTMAGALPLGSIALAAVRDHPERKATFMNLMREAVGDIIEEKSGIRPEWRDPEVAPQHERAGSA
jgi:hypothetical protein